MKVTKALSGVAKGVGVLTLVAGTVIAGVLVYASVITTPHTKRRTHV